MGPVDAKRRRSYSMRTFRTRRPLLVKATQCTQPASIITDLGERQVRPGDWIIEGENREHYVVDDAFFQRTFAPIPWEAAEEGRHYGC
jgi:hypothetical protein